MNRLFVSVFALSALVLGTSTAEAQKPFPPEKTENLKVFPKDMPVRALVDTMRSFTNALGVRCTYCHIGNEGEPLNTFNFVSDDKDAKKKARVMLQMVAAINNDHLAKLVDRKSPPINVSCMLNTEVNATSAGAFQQLATAQLAAGDTVGAVASLEKALVLSPNDQRVRQMLDRVKRK